MARVWFTKYWVPQCESKVGMVNDYVLTNPPSDNPIPVVHSCLGEDVSHGATKPARTLMVLLDHVEPIVCTIPQFINLSSSKKSSWNMHLRLHVHVYTYLIMVGVRILHTPHHFPLNQKFIEDGPWQWTQFPHGWFLRIMVPLNMQCDDTLGI